MSNVEHGSAGGIPPAPTRWGKSSCAEPWVQPELTFRLGDQLVPAPAGTFLWAPATFPTSTGRLPTARLLTLFVPGRGEELFPDSERSSD
jgi:hypothetical protein